MKRAPIKVIIVDDHPPIRKGVKAILEESGEIEVTGDAATEAELLDKLKKEVYHVILLDIKLDCKSGIDILDKLKKKEYSTPVLIYTLCCEKDYEERAMRAGAAGYLNKSADPETIVNAIKQVFAGQTYFSSAILNNMITQKSSHRRPHEKLTNREFDILLHISRGIAKKEIGYLLNISDKTVSSHHRRILDKMNFSSDAELIKYVCKNRLDPLD